MAVWTIGDLHLSIGGDKPMEVFRGWDNHVERIKKNWENLVDENDTVVLVGDLSWAMKLEDTAADFSFIDSLPGRKIIIKGNHDYWWGTVKKMEQYLESSGFSTMRILNNNAYKADDIVICGTRGWSYDCPASEIKILNREVGRLRMSLDEGIKLGGELVVFLHYPPVFGDYVCEPIMETLKEYDIKRVYYGHLHGASIGKAVTGIYDGIRFRLVSCDGNSFAPAPVDQLERAEHI